MRTNYKRIKNILLNNFGDSAEVINSPAKGLVLVMDTQAIDDNRVRVVLQDFSSHSMSSDIGIHLKLVNIKDLEHDLLDAIETAFKDNYPTIYIHQKPKAPFRDKDSLLKSIGEWVDASKKVGVGYSLKKLFNLNEVLDSMNEDQLQAVLALMATCYQKAGEDGRRFRKSLENQDNKAASNE